MQYSTHAAALAAVMKRARRSTVRGSAADRLGAHGVYFRTHSPTIDICSLVSQPGAGPSRRSAHPVMEGGNVQRCRLAAVI